jgi:hypothetical protein
LHRLLVAVSASLIIPAAVAVAAPALSASAASPVIVTCAKASGSIVAGIKVTACNTNKVTGGSGVVTTNTTTLAFSIKWKTGQTTTGKGSATAVTPNKCATGYTELKETSTVTGGTAKSLIGGKPTTNICVNLSTGAVTLAPGAKYKV